MEGDPNVGSTSSSAIKKRRRSSEVWKEMRKYQDTDGNVKAECIHCKKSFDGSSKKGTTHLKNHLDRCPANPKRKGPGGRDGDDQHQSLSRSVCGLIKHFSNTERDTSDEEWEDLDASVLISRKDEILQLYQEEKEKLCQFLNNLSCRFTSQLLVYRDIVMDDRCLLVVYYIDDNWERQSKIINIWEDAPDVKDLIEAVKQSCLDWKIDRKICSVLLPYDSLPADDRDNQIGKMESWFSQRCSLPFAGCLHHADLFMGYITDTMFSKDYIRGGIQSLKVCALYVHNKSTSDKLIQLDGAVENAISDLLHDPYRWGVLGYFRSAVRLKEVFFLLEQLDSDFRSVNLTKQKWDEVTATFEHLKFLKDVSDSFLWGKCHIPIIVDLPYVHKTLKDRCNHRIEDCLFCENVMKEAIDLYFSKYYLVRVIASILDPRFKMNSVQLHYKEIYGSDADRYIEKVNKDFKHVYDEYAATDSSNSKSYEMLDAMGRPSSPKSELDRYFNLLKVPRDQHFDILAWWRGNATFYPTLARMARDYLALPFPRHRAVGVVGLLDEYFNNINNCDIYYPRK